MAASLLLAARAYSLWSDADKANHSLALTRNRSAMATLDSFSLPANQKVEVCNQGDKEITISAVTAFYSDARGKLRNFNSALSQWHAWKIPAASRQVLSLADNGSSVWDGSAVFYSLEIELNGKHEVLTGTSEDLRNGCIVLASR
jgi:streptogramin lyase